MATQEPPLRRSQSIRPTPFWWRLAIAAVVALVGGTAYTFRETLFNERLNLQWQSAVGFCCLLGLAACFSTNLRAVKWRTIACGVALQLALGWAVLIWRMPALPWLGIKKETRPGYAFFESIGDAVAKFIDFSDEGARFVFGQLANPDAVEQLFGPTNKQIIAFTVLPPIIFISSFFSVLYFFGVLQFIVRLMAQVMMYLMRTSGAETLSSAANVFMGQTEAPLIVKPYVPKMTESELLALMVGGMATISGSLMVVYVGLGGDRVAILATSVMAAPCGLYMAKLILPETETPVTSGKLQMADEETHVNAIDAAAAGASDGMRLAINVAAMLIAFLALLAMADFLLGQIATGQPLWQTLQEASASQLFLSLLAIALAFAGLVWLLSRLILYLGPRRPLHQLFGTETGVQKAAGVVVFGLMLYALLIAFLAALGALLPHLPYPLELKHIFGAVFSPLAFLMGVHEQDTLAMANLLGTKIAANEFVAFLELSNLYRSEMHNRSVVLASYALTGFANFGSVGIQIGGIGAIAPGRRSDLARLGMRALLVGFVVTVTNAAVAGMMSNLSK